MCTIAVWFVARCTAATQCGYFIFLYLFAIFVFDGDVAIYQQRTVGRYFYNRIYLYFRIFIFLLIFITEITECA